MFTTDLYIKTCFRVQDTLIKSKKKNTLLSYEQSVHSFHKKYKEENYQNLILYLQGLLDDHKSLSTIKLRYYGILNFYTHRGIYTNEREKFILKEFLKGAKNTIGSQQKYKNPVLRNTGSGLKLSDIDNYIYGSKIRNKEGVRLAIHLCFTGGFRINEVLKLTDKDIEIKGKQAYIYVRNGKTDDRVVLINNCDVTKKLRQFINFDSVGTQAYQIINNTIKRASKKVGLNSKNYGTHSLRAGFVTQATIYKASISQIMNRTGHKNINTLSRYIRIAQDYNDTLKV